MKRRGPSTELWGMPQDIFLDGRNTGNLSLVYMRQDLTSKSQLGHCCHQKRKQTQVLWINTGFIQFEWLILFNPALVNSTVNLHHPCQAAETKGNVGAGAILFQRVREAHSTNTNFIMRVIQSVQLYKAKLKQNMAFRNKHCFTAAVSNRLTYTKYWNMYINKFTDV